MFRLGISLPSLRKLLMDRRKLHGIMRALLYTVIGTSMVIFLSTFVDLSVPKTPVKQMVYEDTRSMSTDLKRDIARELKKVMADLKHAKDYTQPPTTRTLLQLERILGRLDPRLIPVPDSDVQTQNSQLLADNQTDKVEVCPEHYKGHDVDDAYYNNAFIAECSNKVSLQELVTVILDGTEYEVTHLDTLVAEIISRYSGLPIHVALSSRNSKKVIEKHASVTLVRVTSSTPPAVRWARLLKHVRTKYVLVGYKMSSFSLYTDIERLIRTYRKAPDVSYVSGAMRNETGHWTLECFQTRLELYGMAIREGYTNSAEECMYCDAVSGPFLTTTKMLTTLPLDERLPEAVIFFDWFLRIRENGGMGMACPDVLFSVKGNMKQSLGNHDAWRHLAGKWSVTDIYLPARNIHRYTCEEAKLKCSGYETYLASPPCCVARLSRALRDAVAAFDKAAVNVHVAGKTVVGGVKGGLQPWEAEAYMVCSNSKLDIDNALVELRKNGFIIQEYHQGNSITYHLNAYSHTIKLHPQILDMKGELPRNEKETPTRMHVGNGWVPAPPNPGLYARGFQGRGSLQHRPLEGSWPRCGDPTHHACLDHLPLDGSWARLR